MINHTTAYGNKHLVNNTTMIQANELRIGNWVISAKTDEPFKVDEIPNNAKITATPIPLTEDILMKCEFYVSTGTVGPIYTIDDIPALEILFDTHNEVWSVSYGDLLLAEINSLHQLQNLFFALTGEELNIEL